MAQRTRHGLVTADAPATTTPFDVKAFIRAKDQESPGFAAAVEAELATLRLDERLRELRKEHHVTQAQLATRMGVTQSAVAQLERSDPGRMEIRTLARMATALGYGLTIEFEAKQAVTRSKSASARKR